MSKNRPQHTQRIAFLLLFFAAIIVVLPVIFIVLYIIKQGWPALSWEFLSTMPRNGMREGGIFPAIVGTIYLIMGTVIFSVPLGVLAAVYLVEYAKDNWVTRIIKLAIVNLAGVPSVVYGLFGFGIFVIFLKFGTSILAGSLTLSIMVLPIIITTTKEALTSVPQSFREVSISLGVSKWQTIRYCVLPYAMPGILTGTILA
ncbi:MAG: phosphate ABC transporter permease PstA, partial [Candidatus Omnitrophica bacterium]|nr:phosphate ABC transporter permease PstA [Candidatus Omnitrophota bacterium]MBU1997819.1 phosphate ABC transporter permease PstA [Candidatus Omnitrophota bacterium]